MSPGLAGILKIESRQDGMICLEIPHFDLGNTPL
jgi:hypothetical protein